MAEHDYSLTTSTRVSQILNKSSLIDDSELVALTGSASMAIERHCNRLFLRRGSSYTEYFDNPDSVQRRHLYPKQWPLTSVTTVHEDPDRSYGTDTLLTSGTDYWVDTQRSRITRDSSYWLNGYQVVKAVYVGGYANQAAVPDDLAEAAAQFTAWLWKQTDKGASRLGVTAMSAADGNVSGFVSSMPPHIKNMLATYRRRIGFA